MDIKRLSDGVIAKSDLQYKNKYISSLKRRKKIVKIDPKHLLKLYKNVASILCEVLILLECLLFCAECSLKKHV